MVKTLMDENMYSNVEEKTGVGLNEVVKKCSHCHNDLAGAEIFLEDKAFCCLGCRAVYTCLHSSGLDFYYELSAKEGRDLVKAEYDRKYIYLKDKDFLREYQVEDHTFVFYVSGIECIACTWLFDNISSLHDSILYGEYLHEDRIVKVKVRDPEELHDAIYPIVNLGYELKPLKNILDARQYSVEKKRNDLIRLAVVMAIMGNINLFSLSHYFGLPIDDGFFYKLFAYISAVIFLPIPFYASIPFYKTSWDFLKKGKISLDLPIAFSIVMGSLLSYLAVFQGTVDYYFDSLTTLVFLILLIRFFLDELYQKKGRYDFLEEIYGESQVFVREGDEYNAKHISQVQQGDIIKINSNEASPVEGVMNSDTESYFNEALITGESKPILKKKGDIIHASSLNYSVPTEVRVTKTLKGTTFARYIEEFKNKKQDLGGYSSFAKRYASVLLFAFLILSVALFALLSFDEAARRVLALVIICCPCSLGIGIPLATLLANRGLLKKGIIIKKPEFLSQIQKVKKIFFDKTGTLTTGLFFVKKTMGDKRYIPYLVSLESYSSHPIAKAICKHFPEKGTKEVLNFRDVMGVGPVGEIDGKTYEAMAGKAHGEIVLKENGKEVLSVFLQEEYRHGLQELLSQLDKEYKLAILSGDSEDGVRNFMENTGLKNIKTYAGLSPFEKKEIVSQENSLYLGDGLNDIPALSKTGLSISLNAIPLVDDASDCVFVKSDLGKLSTLFSVFKHAKRLIKTNIGISIVYNLIGGTFAVLGYCSPLVAAIFMPISSFFVVSHTLIRARRF